MLKEKLFRFCKEVEINWLYVPFNEIRKTDDAASNGKGEKRIHNEQENPTERWQRWQVMRCKLNSVFVANICHFSPTIIGQSYKFDEKTLQTGGV